MIFLWLKKIWDSGDRHTKPIPYHHPFSTYKVIETHEDRYPTSPEIQTRRY
ncbi:MAG: hypothetical protein HC799_03570 [Limnothrix sp. RL_2_0]|nr:hypothetical protein [Limnothrix sp. RL_2_0]